MSSRFQATRTSASCWRRSAPGLKVVQLKQQTIQRAELDARQVSAIQKLVEPFAPVFSRQNWPAGISYQRWHHHACNMRDVLVKEHTHVRPLMWFGLRPIVLRLINTVGQFSQHAKYWDLWRYFSDNRLASLIGSLGALVAPSAAGIFAVHAHRHHLTYRYDRDEQGDDHGRVNFGNVAWGNRPDHGCHPGCGALQTRTSQESATSLAGHAPYARLVTP